MHLIAVLLNISAHFQTLICCFWDICINIFIFKNVFKFPFWRVLLLVNSSMLKLEIKAVKDTCHHNSRTLTPSTAACWKLEFGVPKFRVAGKILIKAIVNLLRSLTAELKLFDLLITGSSSICWLELSLPDDTTWSLDLWGTVIPFHFSTLDLWAL